MPPKTVEERLLDLETKVAQLLDERTAVPKNPGLTPLPSWLQQWVRAFHDDPEFDTAMERGAEYRRSQLSAADEWDAIEAERTRSENNDLSA